MNDITESDILRAKRLRENGLSWKGIGKAIGKHADTIRCYLDDTFRQRRNLNKSHQRVIARLDKAGTPGMIETPIPPTWYKDVPRLIAERDGRLAVPRTLDNILNGTPIKGRSALDGWKPQGADPAKNGMRPQPWHPLRKGEAREAAE